MTNNKFINGVKFLSWASMSRNSHSLITKEYIANGIDVISKICVEVIDYLCHMTIFIFYLQCEIQQQAIKQRNQNWENDTSVSHFIALYGF